MLLSFVVLLCGCSNQADSTDAEGATGQDASAGSSVSDAGQKNSPGSYTGSISDIEYAFILWSFRDQVVSDFAYTLGDADGDGANERW